MLDKKVQLNVSVSQELNQILDGIAKDSGTTRTDVYQAGIGFNESRS